MKEFVDKWKNDSKFKTKIKLGLYTLFVIFVAIFAISNKPSTLLDNYESENNKSSEEIQNDKFSLEIPEEYNYIINVTINNNNYKFEGTITKEKEIIKKISNEIENNYIYENNNYYQKDGEIYVITTKEKVYEPIKLSYIEIDTINEYLSKSTKENDKYIIYLKDIILGNDSTDYITINIEDDILNNKKIIDVDYTNLMKYFDNNTESYIVNMEIE